MRLWRINLKPGSCEPGIDATEFCVGEHVVGIGWRVEPIPATREEYWALGEQRWRPTEKQAWTAAARALLFTMETGDLVWTRNRTGSYYLGSISGPWQYRAGDGYLRSGVVNVRPCEWAWVGAMDAVPGSVITSFIPRRTLQAVNDPSALLYSRNLFARLRGDALVREDGAKVPDILELLSPTDLEDVAAIYLQVEQGCVMFPSTCKRDTLAVECLLASVADGRRVGLQVKRGNERIDRDTFDKFDGTVYLFQARGLYAGRPNPKCVCLAPETMRAFVRERRALMPTRIQRWLEFVEGWQRCEGRA